jgi:hypothetical protein
VKGGVRPRRELMEEEAMRLRWELIMKGEI